MTSRLIFVAAALSILGSSRASAQLSDQSRRDLSTLDDWIAAGRYGEAAKLAQTTVNRLAVLQRDNEILPFLVYSARLEIERGRPEQASQLLKSATTLKARNLNPRYDAALMREQAAFLYESGDYAEAAAVAAQAFRGSVDEKYYRVRTEYCRSLQALALLRMGRLVDAERLASMAVKAVPRKPSKSPGYAPRILQAACVILAHNGRSNEAEEFCSRSLSFVQSAAPETRDIILAHLAFAEYRLQAGDLVRSRESALQAVEAARRLFHGPHQDKIEALAILASIDMKEFDQILAPGENARTLRTANALAAGEGHEVERDPSGLLSAV